jgi:hypothetical protein
MAYNKRFYSADEKIISNFLSGSTPVCIRNSCGDKHNFLQKSEWHKNWQSYFPYTEIEFPKKCDRQTKNRRSDILVSEFKRVIKIQHSSILFAGHKVLWIIHGQKDLVSVKKIGSDLILDFHNSWIYDQFLECNTVYYDIDDFIYQINPSNVLNYQITVCAPMLKPVFIENLKTLEAPFIQQQVFQSHLYINQSGAGSGKTYSMFQQLNDNPNIIDLKWIIFLSKQHSAVNVMYREFKDQYANNKLTRIKLVEEYNIDEKKHIVQFRYLDTGSETCAIFATVDSFNCNVGQKYENCTNMFDSIAESIKNGVSKLKKDGSFRFAEVNPLMNKESCIFIDETQDLSELYGEAFLKFLTSNGTSLYVVGDKLQSLHYGENALTLFLDKAYRIGMKVVINEANNDVRRFSDPRLVNFVNSVINFEQYGIPQMRPTVQTGETDCLTIFTGSPILPDKSIHDFNVSREVKQIMKYYTKEVVENTRIPEDFIIITPFTKKNPLCDALQIELNMFWKNKIETDELYIEKIKDTLFFQNINRKYNRYSIFHKSEDVGSINLTESKHATRIVSIHTSKGDGRKVAFVIGLSQSALQVYSKICGNLIYDSLLHVSITRQKQKLYFRLDNTYDDIYKRISKNNQCNFEVDTACFNFKNTSIDLSKCCSLIPLTSIEVILKNVIGKPIDQIKKENLHIDIGDHYIRYSLMLINIIIFIINHELKSCGNVKRQFSAILHKVLNARRKSVLTSKMYYAKLRDNKVLIQKVIPVIKYTVDSRTDYTKYYKIIKSNIHNIKKKLRKMTCSEIQYFCPLESVILYYMIECVENGKYQRITIDNIYNIIDTYDKAFNSDASGHEYCKCKKYFSGKIYVQNNSAKKYQDHYDQLKHVCLILNKFVLLHPTINWLYSYPVTFKCNKTEFNLYKSYILIGYDEKTVFIFTLKPQFNDINFNEECIKQVFDTWLVLNTQNKKFADKNIVSCVLALNRLELYEKDWTSIVSNNKSFLTNIVYDVAYDMFSTHHKNYFNTFGNLMTLSDPNDAPNDAPNDMDKIISECKKQLTDRTAYYIKEFINTLESKIEDWDDSVSKFLNYLGKLDNSKFITTLDKRLKKSLTKYLSG